MPNIEDLKHTYIIRGYEADFSIGRRSALRYALRSCSVSLTQINPKGPEPLDYLEYAKSDLSGGSPKGPINSLGNAKRAVHLTMETILRIWALNEPYGKSKFPKKLEIMGKLNAFPIRTLNALNDKRNIMEHDYESITQEEAEDFADVAEMFLLISYPYFKNAIIRAYVGTNEDDRCFEWRLDRTKGEVQVFVVYCDKFLETDLGRIHYNMNEDNKRSMLKTVKVKRDNIEEWLLFLDLFVYLTKRLSVRLPLPDERGHGMRLNTFSQLFS